MLSREMLKVADHLFQAPAAAITVARAMGWQRTRASKVLRMLQFRSIVDFNAGQWRIHPESEYIPQSQHVVVGRDADFRAC